MRASYSRPVDERYCTHFMEAHVRHEDGGGYRAFMRCKCGKDRLDSRRLRPTVRQAEADGKVMAEMYSANLQKGAER